MQQDVARMPSSAGCPDVDEAIRGKRPLYSAQASRVSLGKDPDMAKIILGKVRGMCVVSADYKAYMQGSSWSRT